MSFCPLLPETTKKLRKLKPISRFVVGFFSLKEKVPEIWKNIGCLMEQILTGENSTYFTIWCERFGAFLQKEKIDV